MNRGDYAAGVIGRVPAGLIESMDSRESRVESRVESLDGGGEMRGLGGRLARAAPQHNSLKNKQQHDITAEDCRSGLISPICFFQLALES